MMIFGAAPPRCVPVPIDSNASIWLKSIDWAWILVGSKQASVHSNAKVATTGINL
jgi:hypothetical protein